MVDQAILVAMVGGLLCLDRTVFQSMVSRPIVSAPIIGFLLHDPHTGLITGAFTELFWIDRSSIGAHVPPNDTLAAVVVTAVAIMSAQPLDHVPRELVALAFLVCLPVGWIGQRLDEWKIAKNERRVRQVVKEVSAGKAHAGDVARRHLQSLVYAYALDALFLLAVLIPAQMMLVGLYTMAPTPAMKALLIVYFLLPVIGVGVALNTIHIRGAIPFFCGLFLVVNLVLEMLRPG